MGRSIFNKLLSTSLIMIVSISIVIGIISYSVAARILIDETEKYLINELKQIDRSLMTIVEDVNQSAGILQDNKSLSHVFDASAKTSFQRYEDASEVEKWLKISMSNNDAIQGIAVLSEFQDFSSGSRLGLLSYGKFRQLPIYQEKLHHLQDDQYMLLRADDIQAAQARNPKLSNMVESGNLIILAKRISSYQVNDIIVLCYVSTASIMTSPTGGLVYAVDPLNHAAWNASSEKLDNPYPSVNWSEESKSEGSLTTGDTRLIYMKSSFSDWYMINAVSEKNIVQPLHSIFWFIILCVSIMIVICAATALIASRGLTLRIRSMKNAVHLKGMDIRSPLPGFDLQSRGFLKWIHSIRFGNKLFVFYIGVVILPMLVLSLLLYQKTVNTVESQLEQSFRQPLVQAASGIDMLMNRHIRNVKYMITNANVQELLVAPVPGQTEEYLKRMQAITDEIMKKSTYHAGLNSIEIYNINWKLLYSSSNINERNSWEAPYLKQNMTWVDTYSDAFQNKVFSLIHEIKGNILFKEGFAVPIGYIKLNINETLLSQVYKDVRISDKGIIYIKNRDGLILSSNDMQLINSHEDQIPLLSTGDKVLMADKDLTFSEWSIHAIVPEGELLGSKYDLILYNLIVISMMTLVLVIVSMLSSRAFVRPVQSLMQVIREVKEGNFGSRFREKSGDEIEILGHSFNGMLDRLQGLIEEITQSKNREQEMETKKREAELNALQSQINPHFLYNTFESINWLVIQNENDKAVTMMTSLADLFRIGINRGQNIVGLDEELQHAEAYITIQKIRYNEKLNVQWNTQVDPKRYKTMKLVLQPIIENAIYHGIELMEDAGTIEIGGYIEDNRLYLQIIDNGLGIQTERLSELRERFSNWYSEPSRSIGLLNVNERIKLMFGDEYGLRITSKVNEGTIVTVVLPVVHRDEE
ncbi:sensor histidine kinase [Paenibacillus mendelii]|uniref:histidine kinase n=1 Tax=Paenibacillus mendelii TaxID=206163 RepID=A0ABV6JQ51_9BACL|nr:sensor histidine kinase [Paenibacillus mendelii]MCQ6562315.1 sensor histidine kinase [Paenibacillus mendelii]